MYGSFYIFMPMAVGALLVIMLCLYKGDICPGQRGRLHKWLPFIAIPLAFTVLSDWFAVIPLGLLGIFCLKVKTGKTRQEGPRLLLVVSVVLAAAVWLKGLNSAELPLIAISTICLPLCGAAYSHLVMTVSRSRLQAFHRILPIVGLLSAMLMMLAWVWSWKMIPAEEVMIGTALLSLLSIVAAVLLWVSHMLLLFSPSKRQLVGVNILILFSLLNQMSVIA